ncbi:MAG: nucleoside hydrolase [Phycisphaeraceae bacterium]
MNHFRTTTRLTLLACVLALVTPTSAADDANVKIPVIFDTDIGTGIDDAFALAALVSDPKIDLRAVTTVGEGAEDRAWIVCRFLTAIDKREIPIAFGRGEQPKIAIDWQIQYRRHAAVVWNRTIKPVKEPAVELLFATLKAANEKGEKVTILAGGPLTNIALLLENHPECKAWIERLIVVQEVHATNPDPKFSRRRTTFQLDPKAARLTLAAGVPVFLLGSVPVNPTHKEIDALFDTCNPLTLQLQALNQLCDPFKFQFISTAGAMLITDEPAATWRDAHVLVDDAGLESLGKGAPNAKVSAIIKSKQVLDRYLKQVAAFAEPVVPKPPGNVSKLIEQGGFPRKVHVVEDFETDIEKRWWLTGKPERGETAAVETKEDVLKLPGGIPLVTPHSDKTLLALAGNRVMRATLTQDFDDKQGDRDVMYRAVVFNPVPGPPMGPNTRLSFRYKLTGTDTLRVQIFSLSNGYHRCLSLKGLPQGKWQHATVDMTQARRPDGTGGPLKEDERIDDIQFYVDPRADLFIDDIVLYDAAPDDEKEPFPRHITFTGWFDTGKQGAIGSGAEWPGEFEIVLHEKPRTWDAARSVVAKNGETMLRLGLRGMRPLVGEVAVRFRYKLTGTAWMELALRNSKEMREVKRTVKEPTRDDWATATILIPAARDGVKDQHEADELIIRIAKGSTLLVDDVLIYEPAK